ncbi:helix-turn-helix transcriptional regulator [Paucihalobacter ruber]|uniref:Helix-turn-helix transcriptional regulator n=1 Tax=Paucihalobacter ruber TaxID=2567861 RepID=A0A506PNN1_9FLAO|nr:AraC family transcriptional regulator [Paucihalobacter ruber]TPV34902.1 helix-turn-helix transcriptional regulator [Paucihalobacter ruber]
MKEINLTDSNILENVKQMQRHIGGSISQKWGEYVLEVDNRLAKGCIKYITFDWGVSLVDFNIIFFEDMVLTTGPLNYNPIHFIYSTKGFFEHKFSDEENYKKIEQFHSVITAGSSKCVHQFSFQKDVHIQLNIISIIRKQFLKKRLNISHMLNDKLHNVFVDTQHNKQFLYYGPISLKMADHIDELQNIESGGIIRTLQIEGEVYQLLSMHIKMHNTYENSKPLKISLLKSELKKIRQLAKKITQDSSKNYSLNEISRNSGLSQAKLQEGFKFLYARTVNDYIRHARLQEARDLMYNSNLNISQIVYSIGFTSRSYFSKIFKEKYGIPPNEFKKQIIVSLDDDLK